MNFSVRPAEGAEIRLCRMLLGNEGCTHPHYQLFVAEGETGLPVGAGSLRSGAKELGEYWGVHIELVPPCRNPDVEAGLIAYARSQAAAHGATQIKTLRWFRRDSDDQRQWQARGFTPTELRYVHEMGVAESFARLGPVFEEVRNHGWIPDDARAIALAEADLREVCELHLEPIREPWQHVAR